MSIVGIFASKEDEKVAYCVVIKGAESVKHFCDDRRPREDIFRLSVEPERVEILNNAQAQTFFQGIGNQLKDREGEG